jgi:hypothetical protein
MGKIIFDMPNRKLENAVKEKIVTLVLSNKQKLFIKKLKEEGILAKK